MKNFTRPENEKPYYFASTVEDGKVITHEGEMEHAVYLSEMRESRRRSNLWHKWVENTYGQKAYNGIGVLDSDIYYENQNIYREFMDGEREE